MAFPAEFKRKETGRMKPELHLSLRYPLRDFELEIDTILSQQITGVFGASGSGKTSLVESLIGLRTSAKGCIRFGKSYWLDDDAGIRVKPQHRNIGYVPQQPLIFPHLSGMGNLRYGEARAAARGLDSDSLRNSVIETLELGPFLDQKVDQLSGGERQRLALGRALCSGPEILMLDEPLSALDIRLRKRILPFLLRIREHFEIPMLIVSHHPVDLMTLCDEVLVLQNGKIIAQDTPLKVFSEKTLFGNVASEGFRNVINAVVDKVDVHVSHLRIGDEVRGQEAVVIGSDLLVGHTVKLSFSPTDVLLSRSPIKGISARNQWEAEVVSIEESEDQVIVLCEIGGSKDCQAVVQLTTDALDELKIIRGSDVFLILKSSAIEVIA